MKAHMKHDEFGIVIPFWAGLGIGVFIGIILMWQFVLWWGIPLQ